MILRPLLVANADRVVGGGEVGLLMLAEGLAARGHRPTVAVPGRGGLASHLEHAVIGPSPGEVAEGLRRLASHADVVHVYSGRAVELLCHLGIANPVVYHVLVPDPQPRDREDARRADVLVCNSYATAARFDVDVRARADLRVVYNGVAPPRPTPEGLVLDPSRQCIAVIGGTVPRKGQLDALPALLDVIDVRDDVDVAFIGRMGGVDAMKLRRVARGSGGRVRLLGYVPNAADHMGSFALVLVPSRQEGFGRVAVESLRAGVPVLATPVGGLPEALREHPDPWLPADRRAWATRILRELREPTLTADELRVAARPFAPDRFVAEIEAVHRQLAPRAAGTARSESA